MSTEIVEKMLGRVYQDGLVVYDHVRDPIYRYLGYAQLSAMFITVCALGVVTVPMESNTAVYWMYQKMDDAFTAQYPAQGGGVAVLNYLVWTMLCVLSGSLIGKKIGSGVWATYCLMRTGCRSRHTMDLPLGKVSLERVTQTLLRDSLSSDPGHYAMLLNPEKVKEIKDWLQQVNLFFTAKRIRDIKRGKIQAAESWWLVKKQFYTTYKIETLAGKLLHYENLLRGNLHRLRNHLVELQQYQDLIVTGAVACVKTFKRDVLRWMLNVMDDFDRSVGVRHEKRSVQNIYQDKKQLSHWFSELSAVEDSIDVLQRHMLKAETLLLRIESRIRADQAKIPLMPSWLLVLVEDRVVAQSEVRCFELLGGFFGQCDDVLDRMCTADQQAFYNQMRERFDERMNRLRRRLPRKSKSVSFSSNDSTESQDYETARCISERPLLNAIV